MLVNIRRRRHRRLILPTFLLKSVPLGWVVSIYFWMLMVMVHISSVPDLLDQSCWFLRQTVCLPHRAHFRPWLISIMRRHSGIGAAWSRMRCILVKESGSSGHDVLHLLVAHFLHHFQWVKTADWRRSDILRILHYHFFLFKYLLQILIILVRRAYVEAVLREVLPRGALMLARTLR